MSSKITYETLQTFLATLFVATEVATPFVWDDKKVKRAIIEMMRKDQTIRALGLPLLSRQYELEGAPGNKGGKQPAYEALFDWFRGGYLDTIDPLRTTKRINDKCLRFANERRALLDAELHAAIKAHAKSFYLSTQLNA